MLGQLPKSLNVNHKSYKINSDYRNILRIISAFNADELSETEKMYVCLKRLYESFFDIPVEDYESAYMQAVSFIECQIKSDKPGPKIVDWEKDEQMIFAAVNKVAGKEIREVPYMHWWTFLGYFQSIDRDDIWGFVLTIRQKKAKRRKLEKYETEFYNANKNLIVVGDVEKAVNRKKDAEDYAERLYKELLAGKGD
jgi:hypothetical protein